VIASRRRRHADKHRCQLLVSSFAFFGPLNTAVHAPLPYHVFSTSSPQIPACQEPDRYVHASGRMPGRMSLILVKAPTSCSLSIGRSFISWRTSRNTDNRASTEPSRKSSPTQPHPDFVYGPTRKGQTLPPPKVEHKNFAKLGGGVVSSMFIDNQAGPFGEDDFARGLPCRSAPSQVTSGPPRGAAAKTNNSSSITLDRLFRLRRESAKAKKSLQARIHAEG
jgi:hypothetical protein